MGKQTDTKSEKILLKIWESGGMKFRDIQKFIFEMNNPGKTFGRKNRGYWCIGLLGSAYHGRAGLLARFCTRLPDGRYIVTEPIKAPFTLGPTTKTLLQNEQLRLGRIEMRKRAADFCNNCGDSLYNGLRVVGGKRTRDDHVAHVVQGIVGGIEVDCRHVVWIDGRETKLYKVHIDEALKRQFALQRWDDGFVRAELLFQEELIKNREMRNGR